MESIQEQIQAVITKIVEIDVIPNEKKIVCTIELNSRQLRRLADLLEEIEDE